MPSPLLAGGLRGPGRGRGRGGGSIRHSNPGLDPHCSRQLTDVPILDRAQAEEFIPSHITGERSKFGQQYYLGARAYSAASWEPAATAAMAAAMAGPNCTSGPGHRRSRLSHETCLRAVKWVGYDNEKASFEPADKVSGPCGTHKHTHTRAHTRGIPDGAMKDPRCSRESSRIEGTNTELQDS